jgi:acyl-coenzyme A synthetase/AMP-(fatty) acid ligase
LPYSEQKKLSSVRQLLAAGAPLGRSEQNALRKLCHPEAKFTQVWGLTEIGWITMFRYPEADETASVGRLLPNMEAK